jgi:hypothetical protein
LVLLITSKSLGTAFFCTLHIKLISRTVFLYVFTFGDAGIFKVHLLAGSIIAAYAGHPYTSARSLKV